MNEKYNAKLNEVKDAISLAQRLLDGVLEAEDNGLSDTDYDVFNNVYSQLRQTKRVIYLFQDKCLFEGDK